MNVLKVWYPGPAVPPGLANEATQHYGLGILKPGWNEVPECEEVRSALVAGLFSLTQPKPLPVPVADVPTPRAARKVKE